MKSTQGASLIGDEAFDFLLIIPMPNFSPKNYFIGDEDNLERQVWPLGAVAARSSGLYSVVCL